mmetsp:Transcript_27103/g.69814  ORF Transcript_27103/g.69814 Transcript_27103/m.69814 type:complete len:103 (-) Transcript_27103:1648-1956(-)
MSKQVVLNNIKENKVMIFSKSYCPFCTQVKRLYQGLGVNFGLIELDEVENGAEMQSILAQISGQRTVPNVFIGGEHAGGCDDSVRMNRDGSLKKKLEAAGAL